MGNLKIRAAKQVCRSHRRLKLLVKTSSKFVVIAYVPIILIIFHYLIIFFLANISEDFGSS